MRRATVNFLVDSAALLAMLSMIATGLIIKFLLPPRSAGGGGLEAFGYSRHEWGDFHFWAACVLGGLVLLHLVLHWQWVCATLRFAVPGSGEQRVGSSRRRTALGFVTILAAAGLVGAFFTVTAENVTSTAGGRHAGWSGRSPDSATPPAGWEPGRGRPEASRGLRIRGSMTLGELAEAAEIPFDQLCLELGLPALTSKNERLGQLSRTYGIQMQEIRRTLAQLTDREDDQS